MGALRNLALTLRMSAAAFLRIARARAGGREYVPDPRSYLFIEPTTHCNLECKFCTYRLERRDGAVMDGGAFADTVRQAVAMGFDRIAVTPINGDVFVDKGMMDKLRFLETCDGISGFLLYTNLIAASPQAIAEVAAMRRVALFNVSVYGHDRASFEAVTGRGDTQYRRLVDNLRHLAQALPAAPCRDAFQLSVRTGRRVDLDHGEGELLEAVRALRRLGVPVTVQSRCDDWGGLIGEADMRGLDMDLIRGRLLYKKGACTLPFNSVQVLADGRVNACACRDIDGQLQIGDTRTQPLADILSARNPAYVGLIERQQRGDFPPACQGCSFYRSIYDPAAAGPGSITLAEFWRRLGR